MREKIHIIARGLVIDDEKILICKGKNFDDFYFLPGGHVEYREDIRGSLIRELKEEIGYNFKIDKYIGCIENIFEDKRLCHDHEYNFLFAVSSEDFSSNMPLIQIESHIELIWIELSKLNEIPLKPKSLIEIIDKFQNSFDIEPLMTELANQSF